MASGQMYENIYSPSKKNSLDSVALAQMLSAYSKNSI